MAEKYAADLALRIGVGADLCADQLHRVCGVVYVSGAETHPVSAVGMVGRLNRWMAERRGWCFGCALVAGALPGVVSIWFGWYPLATVAESWRLW